MAKTQTLNPLDLTTVIYITIGLTFLAIGLYRVSPLKFDQAFWWQNGPLIAMFAGGAIIVYCRYRPGIVHEWGQKTVLFGGKFLPLMVLLCIVMGLGTVVVKLCKAEIGHALLSYPRITVVGASIIMPTSSTATPIIQEYWNNPALQPYLLYFLSGASLMSVPILMMRKLGISNPEISAKMWVSGMLVSIIILPFAPVILMMTNWILRVAPWISRL